MFDFFGVNIELNFLGHTKFKTLGGAISSILMVIFIFSYFYMLALRVSNYSNPQISSYEIIQESQKEEMRLGDMKVDFIFGFFDHEYNPTVLDPKYGRFELYQRTYGIDSNGKQIFNETPVGVRNFSINDIDKVKWGFWSRTGSPEGIYTAKDMNSLSIKGYNLDNLEKQVTLYFVPCLD